MTIFLKALGANAEKPNVLFIAIDDLNDWIGKTGKNWALELDTAGSHETVLRFKEWERAVEGYLACITYIDHEVGHVLDALDMSPHKDNTIIVSWSDHGWYLGEKQHWGKWTNLADDPKNNKVIGQLRENLK